jgi:hypothetical protein
VGSDRHQLASMADQARAEMVVETLNVVADRGYYDSQEILACEEAGITVTLPKPLTSGAKAAGRFGKQDFIYVAAEDIYRCPGERLTYRFTAEEHGKMPPLLDDCLPHLCAQSSVHDWPRTAYPALGARGCAGEGSASARPRPQQDNLTPADGGASVRDHQGLDGCGALPDAKTTEGSNRDGA